MANGDPLSTAKAKGLTQQGVGYKLLDGQSAVGDGPWVDVRALGPGSVHVFGNLVGHIQIHVSNSDSAPLSTDEGVQLGADITTFPQMISIGMPVRWIKATIPTGGYTSGSGSAFFHSTS